MRNKLTIVNDILEMEDIIAFLKKKVKDAKNELREQGMFVAPDDFQYTTCKHEFHVLGHFGSFYF